MNKQVVHSSFANKSTSTLGKLKATEWQFSQSTPIQNPNKHSLVLVGATDGYQRHINESTQLGVLEENIIFVERDQDCYQNLKEYKEKFGFRNLVVHGDFLEVMNDCIGAGISLGFVDFDGIEVFGSYHVKLLEICFQQQIDLIHMTFCTKSRNSFLFDTIFNRLKLPACTLYRGGRKVENAPPRTTKILDEFIPRLLLPINYDYSRTKPYRGRCVMGCFVIQKV